MICFDAYFSDKRIIDHLCKLRASDAQKRHEKQFYRNISYKASNPHLIRSKVDQFLPSRKQWFRPQLKDRKNKSAFKVNALAIKKTIEYKERHGSAHNETWYKQLQEFITKIRIAALQDGNYKILEPTIIPVEKDKKNGIYRPLAMYELEDRMIISLTATYLRDIFDDDFLDCSYAFRAKAKSPRKTPTHHHAVKDILNYVRKFKGKKLFVAECDITKFYDTVHHEVALNALERAIKRANARGITVDSRAIAIFRSFLNSYTFVKTAKVQADEWFKQHKIEGIIKWAEKELEQYYEDLSMEPIGVPQGGALSPLIANLVLDEADRCVIQNTSNPDEYLFFARYCDDMIIIHPDKRKCEQAFKRYISSLQNAKLAIHKPLAIGKYGKEYYSHKSKKPYLWDNPEGRNNVAPWVSFLGYQIRYDMKIRVRKGSLERELEKQVKVADKIIEILTSKNKVSTKTRGQILFRLTNKLISMSVGRIKLGVDENHDLQQFCWSSGFKLLKEFDNIGTQLKQLDRNRERQLSRIKRKLDAHDIEYIDPIENIKAPKFCGAPFSYYSQYLNGEDQKDHGH